MKLKKTVVLTVAAVLMIGVLFAGAVSADASGNCGKQGSNLQWAYYDSTKTLEITGSGEMKDWDPSAYDFAPWHEDYRGLITSVKLPSGLKNIGTYAFYQCTAITSIEIPASVTTIGEGAFQESALTSIEIPASVTIISANAFTKCSALTDVTFAEHSNLTTIGENAFAFSGLTSIEIPASVETIGNMAFSSCPNLTAVTFAEHSNLSTIGMFAFAYSGLTSIEIPASVETIGLNAFCECPNLTKVTFANVSQLTTIGQVAFGDCTALKKVTINAGEFSSDPSLFGEYVFGGCDKLACVISRELQNPDAMNNFGSPVWYIINGTTIPQNDYTNQYIGMLNGGILDSDFEQTKKDADFVLPTQDDVTKTGYAFVKWIDDDKNPITKLNDFCKHATLKWTPVIYTIKYVLDGGTNHADNPATYTIESEDITLQDATWDGYTFDGWYEDAAFTEEITEIAKGSTGNKVLYAKWTPLATGHSPSLPKEYTTPSYVPVMVQETVQPTAAPTPTPAAPTVMPTTKPTTQQTQKSPAPFVGLIAGLGIAGLVLSRLRK